MQVKLTGQITASPKKHKEERQEKDCQAANIILQMNELRYKNGKGDPRGFVASLDDRNIPRGVLPRYLSQAKKRAEQSKCGLVKQNDAKIQEMQDKSKENNEHTLELQQLNVLLEADLIKTFEDG